MSELEKAFEDYFEKSVEEDDLVCTKCGNDEFEVDVWGVEDDMDVPRGAAVCIECDTRLDIMLNQREITKVRKSIED